MLSDLFVIVIDIVLIKTLIAPDDMTNIKCFSRANGDNSSKSPGKVETVPAAKL